MKLKKIALALSLGLTLPTLSLAQELDREKVIKLVQQATKGKAKPILQFNAPSGLTGLVIGSGKKDDKKIIAWVTPDSETLIIGKLTDINGMDLTAVAEQEFGAIRLALTRASGFTETHNLSTGDDGVFGNDDLIRLLQERSRQGYAFQTNKTNSKKDLYIFFDPDCPYCKDTWKDIEMNEKLNKNDVNIFWFPLALREENENYAAAYLEEGAKAYEKTVISGEMPTGQPSIAALRKSRSNRELIALTGQLRTPSVVFKNSEGVQFLAGTLEPSKLGKLFNDIIE